MATADPQALVVRYEALARKSGKSVSVARENRLRSQIFAIERELRALGTDAARRLGALLDHEDLDVRLQAAQAFLSVDSERALRVLDAIGGDDSDAGFEARVAARAWREGKFEGI